MKAELKRAGTSYQKVEKELQGKLLESERGRERQARELAEARKTLSLQSAQVGGKREAMAELEMCRAELQRLEGVVRKEIAEREGVESEARRCEVEMSRLDERWREALARQEEAEKRWREERCGKEACEHEGEELRVEVGRLSQQLRGCQQQLQEEVASKAERERKSEETLNHLQQELARRAQQVSHSL